MACIFQAMLEGSCEYKTVILSNTVDSAIIPRQLNLKLLRLISPAELLELWMFDSYNKNHSDLIGILEKTDDTNMFMDYLAGQNFAIAECEMAMDGFCLYYIGHISRKVLDGYCVKNTLGIWKLKRNRMEIEYKDYISVLTHRNAELTRKIEDMKKEIESWRSELHEKELVRSSNAKCKICNIRCVECALMRCGHVACSHCAYQLLNLEGRCLECGSEIIDLLKLNF